jgi:segregation and condensation protein A
MDLLLHMVGQRKVSIHDVPIHALIEQYLSFMALLREARLEIAAEFLEMAARLVLIKTAALLPVHKEEADDLAEELRKELLDYRDCQYLAGKLRERGKGFDFYARPPLPVPPDWTYRRTHPPAAIYEAYLSFMGKAKRRLPPPAADFSGILAHKIVSVVSRYAFVFERLRARRRAPLQTLLEGSESRSALVATFLAVLSLIKAKRVVAYGSGAGAVLELQTREGEWRAIEDE